MKHIEFSEHATVQAQARSVSAQEIHETIEWPDTKEPTRRGRIKLEKVFKEKKLRVIVKETDRSIIVVTVINL